MGKTDWLPQNTQILLNTILRLCLPENLKEDRVLYSISKYETHRVNPQQIRKRKIPLALKIRMFFEDALLDIQKFSLQRIKRRISRKIQTGK